MQVHYKCFFFSSRRRHTRSKRDWSSDVCSSDLLTPEERQRAMEEHMRIGAEFETIHNHTTYSFGIDDQEFMTAFECDEPSDFMHLMLTLRDTEASRYTERDTPIFVGQHVDIRSALDSLDGKSARVRA